MTVDVVYKYNGKRKHYTNVVEIRTFVSTIVIVRKHRPTSKLESFEFALSEIDISVLC